MTLIIFASDKEVVLQFVGSKHKKRVLAKNLLVGLDALLKQEKKVATDIKGIVAIIDEVTFTVSRQITVVLNTFAFVSKIKIVALSCRGQEIKEVIKQGLKKIRVCKPGGPVVAFYSRPPNITVSAKQLI